MSGGARTPAQSAAIAEFSQIMQCDNLTAEEYLSQNDWNLQAAVQSFAEEMMEDDEQPQAAAPPNEATGPMSSFDVSRTVGGSSAEGPPSSGNSASVGKQRAKKKFGSLRDFEGDNDGQGQAKDDDSEKDQEYFAGGDKSGLAVQEPGSGGRNDPVQRLIDTARRRGPPPPPETTASRSLFSGTGHTLGGDDTPSETVPDPNANTPLQPEMVQRTLHLWDDGFSVDDGPLYRYDDPANAQLLKMINEGSAPTQVMNVQRGQAVDVNLEQHRGEKYQAPKKKYVPFSGGGQRLGSPVPPIPSAGSDSATPVGSSSAQPSMQSVASGSNSHTVEVNEGEPSITLQVRLADGTRLRSRFNTTHTIGDIYAFVDRAQPSQGEYLLATTFPTKELNDKARAIGDVAELKRGGTVVQKWN